MAHCAIEKKGQKYSVLIENLNFADLVVIRDIEHVEANLICCVHFWFALGDRMVKVISK